MPRVSLVWVERPGIEDLDPQALARAAGLELDPGGSIGAAVVTAPESFCPEAVRARLFGTPVKWLDLAAEVGGGGAATRLARAAAAVAREAGRAALGTLPPVYGKKALLTVLVAGQGLSAVTAAYEAAALGHPVLLALPGEGPAQAAPGEDPDEVSHWAARLPAQVEVLPRTELKALKGAAGDFRARLRGPQGAADHRFGAVMLAPAGAPVDDGQGLGLDPELVTPLAGLDPEARRGSDGNWLQAAVLAGVSRPLSSWAFGRALEAALALQQRPFVQATLFYPEARVSQPGGERAYRAAREAGVLTVRVAPEGLAVAGDGRELRWQDPLLNEELALRPDLVVAAQELEAEPPQALGNPLVWRSWQSLLPEHARLGGGRSARSGLYLLGAVRGTAPGRRHQEAAAAAADLHARLAEPMAMPSVRHTYCASCLTCVRVCPHGVPWFYDDQVECAPAGCVACGVCAAECPAEAIAPPGWSNPEMIAGLTAGLAKAASPTMVLFACQQSAHRALAELSRSGHELPAGLLVFPVVCAGRVGMQLIMKALSLGAGGVLVAGCHDGMCRSISGNLRARLRVGQTAELLAELGLSPEAVRFAHVASNQPAELALAIGELAAEAGKGTA